MDSNDSVESDVSTGEMRAETREILVQDNRPFLYFSLNEVLEEFSYEFIVDAVREMLRAQVLLPEEGFDNHTEWWNFGNAIVTAITSVFTFFVEWGPRLCNLSDETVFRFLEILQDMAATILTTMTENEWFDPLDDNDLTMFENNMERIINTIR